MMWCNHTRHKIDFWVDVFLVGYVCWWGRVNLLIWWCSWDVAGWRLNLSYIVNNHLCVPAPWCLVVPVALRCPKIYILIYAGVIHEGIEGFYFDHRQLHGGVHGSSKIRNSVDNNLRLLLKIRFRQKSITFSAVDINRNFGPNED